MPLDGVSSAFIDALRFGAYLVDARLTIYKNGNPTEFTVPVSTLSITVDRNSAQRRQGSITAELLPGIPPPALLPANPGSLLAPFGNEIFIEVGIAQVPAGSAGPAKVLQWIPLGLFSIATVTVDDTTVDLVVTIDVYDRSWVISQRLFTAPYNFPATFSGNFVAEIVNLLNQAWTTHFSPNLKFNIVPTRKTVPKASYNQGSDPWQAALDMAAAVGYELYFDINGVVVGKPVPDPKTQPITWNFTDDVTKIYGSGGTFGGGSAELLGSAYSTPVAVQSVMTRDGIYNDIYITGTGTSNTPLSNTGTNQPVVAEVADSNPASPFFVAGPMGDIPEFVASNLVTTSIQALKTAEYDLATSLGAAWQLTVTFPPNPLFDIDDVVIVNRPRIGIVNRKMVIDTIDYTISYSDTSTLTGRVVL